MAPPPPQPHVPQPPLAPGTPCTWGEGTRAHAQTHVHRRTHAPTCAVGLVLGFPPCQGTVLPWHSSGTVLPLGAQPGAGHRCYPTDSPLPPSPAWSCVPIMKLLSPRGQLQCGGAHRFTPNTQGSRACPVPPCCWLLLPRQPVTDGNSCFI